MKAMHATEKHDGRSEKLAALVAETKELLEQARAAEAARARVAAVEEAAVAAVKAVAEAAAAAAGAGPCSRHAEDADRSTAGAADASSAGRATGRTRTAPDAEETMCVVCFDAPKEYAIVPYGHQCVCEACAEQLTKMRTPMCPVCRGPIRETMKVFCS
jgi:hypothetical protein